MNIEIDVFSIKNLIGAQLVFVFFGKQLGHGNIYGERDNRNAERGVEDRGQKFERRQLRCGKTERNLADHLHLPPLIELEQVGKQCAHCDKHKIARYWRNHSVLVLFIDKMFYRVVKAH